MSPSPDPTVWPPQQYNKPDTELRAQLLDLQPALGDDEDPYSPQLNRPASISSSAQPQDVHKQGLPPPMVSAVATSESSKFELPPPIWGSPTSCNQASPVAPSDHMPILLNEQRVCSNTASAIPTADLYQAYRQAPHSAAAVSPPEQREYLQRWATDAGHAGDESGWDAIAKALSGEHRHDSSVSLSLQQQQLGAATHPRDSSGHARGSAMKLARQQAAPARADISPAHPRTDISWASPPLMGCSASLSLSPGGRSEVSDTCCVSAYGKDLILSVSFLVPEGRMSIFHAMLVLCCRVLALV